jgi:hypothetical protein
MNNTGMNTAARESVIDTMVKPIPSSRQESPASGLPISMCRVMFSSITIASSTTKPTQRERHQRQVVDRESEGIHERERADDRQRQRKVRDDGAVTLRRKRR